MKTTIQVPVDKTLKTVYEKNSSKLGYSSLQEYIRVFLKQNLYNAVEYITPEQEAILDKTWAKSQKDIKKGDFIKSNNYDELVSYLNRG